MIVVSLPLLLVPALVAGQVPVPSQERVVLAMGTKLSLRLEGREDLSRASEAALAEVARIEVACSTWSPDSPWSCLNAAQGRPVALDHEWITLLGQVKAWQARTEGAFDPVLMALMRAWGIRQGGGTPDPRALVEARRASGAGLLDLDPVAGTARLAHPAAGVEEGGFLKGYALDRTRLVAGAPAGLLDFGGQLLAWGRPVEVSVADPGDRQRPRLSFLLRNGSLSGSGTSERGRHILDPRTGEPCPAWGSTAVVAADALTADVLSTALYVLGPDTGPAWAERQGVAAAFLLNDGTIRMSPAFRSLHPTLISRESR
ncbi:MAG TPA: FAD:protein FMN transferase [Geothrix sp.]